MLLLTGLTFVIFVTFGVNSDVSGDYQDVIHFFEFKNESKFEKSADIYIEIIRNKVLQRLNCGDAKSQEKCECLHLENIINIVKENPVLSLFLSMDHLETYSHRRYQLAITSIVILNYFLSHEMPCTNETISLGFVGDCINLKECYSKFSAQFYGVNDERIENIEAIAKILRKIKPNYKPDTEKLCVTAEMILDAVETSGKHSKFRKEILISMEILLNILKGSCIDVEDSASDFIHDIFLHYGEGCDRVLTVSGFAKLLDDLQMQRPTHHLDHGSDLNYCNISDSASSIAQFHSHIITHGQTHSEKKYDRNSKTKEPEKRTFGIPDDKTEKSTFKDQDVYLSDHSFEHKAIMITVDDAVLPIKRVTRYAPTVHEENGHKNLANECLSPNELLQRFLTKGNKVITSSDFFEICPALVQQAVSGVCKSKMENNHAESSSLESIEGKIETNNSFLHSTSIEKTEIDKNGVAYSAAAIFVITLASVVGVLLIPILNKPFYEYVSSFFLGLAFGTMTGDVVLHIMPQYLGLHNHDEEENSDELVPSFVLKQLTFIVVVYLLYMFQTLFSMFFGSDDNQGGHGHSHALPKEIPMQVRSQEENRVPDVEEAANGRESTDPEDPMKPPRPVTPKFNPTVVFYGLTTTALLIIIADTVHNFADGIAVSVAFSTSYKDGISASVAILCHELPHEIADFVVLLTTGLSFRKALVINLLSGVASFIGMAIGIFSFSVFRDYLQAFTGALFLYVAMGEMLPELKLGHRSQLLLFGVKQIGILMGIAAMALIAIYEDKF